MPFTKTKNEDTESISFRNIKNSPKRQDKISGETYT